MTEQTPESIQEDPTPTKDTESKPMSNGIATKIDKPDKPPATRQIQARRRYPPRAPGFFPVPVDIVITMSIQLGLTITNFFVILASFAYSGDDLGWFILFEIIFTYIGFSIFVHKISRQVLVYKKFFRKLNNWHDRKLQELQDDESSCCLLWWILVKIVWWIAALLLFPIIIFWSMFQSYKWYQDKRKHAQSTLDLTQWDNVSGNAASERKYWKMSDRAYSVWHLGVLSKQASMITLFIQDTPLLIMSAMIENYLGIIVYSISIFIKLLFWMKHMIDLGKLTLFYDCIDYLDHFGISEIVWGYLEEYKISIIVPEFYTQWQHEMSTLQRGDWIAVLDEDDPLDLDKMKVMVIYKSRHFKKTENIIAIDYLAVPVEAFDDYAAGKTKNIEIPQDCIHTLNRWSGNIELLRDEDFEKYHDNGGQSGDEEEKDPAETQMAATSVQSVEEQVAPYTESPPETNQDVAGTEVVESGNNDIEVAGNETIENEDTENVKIDINDDKNIEPAISKENNEQNASVDHYDQEVAGDESIENVKIDVNDDANVESASIANENNEENMIDNKATEVNDDGIEDENEESEKQQLNDSPVLVDKEDVDEPDNMGSTNYEPVPLNDDEPDEDEQNEL